MQSDKKQVRDLITLLAKSGVKHVIISPGSRNAPLSISFHHHPDIATYVVVDERSAGYVAIGMAQQLREPVAVCCTSGTAALNYGPAVAEAFYQKVPLLVITADRPVEYIDQGEGQSIRQKGLFHAHIKFECELREGDDRQTTWHNRRELQSAFIALSTPGPVHINVPISENLYGFSPLAEAGPEPIKRARFNIQIEPSYLKELTSTYSQAKRVLVLAGTSYPDPNLQKALLRMAKNPNTLVLTETTSNISGGNIVPSIDRLLMTLSKDEEVEFAPELLITFGHSIISKKIKASLRDNTATQHWNVDPNPAIIDTYQGLTHKIEVEPCAFFPLIAETQTTDSGYGEQWSTRDRKNRENHESFIGSAAYSDFLAFHHILKRIPQNQQLQMGNSSIVRYIQLFSQRTDLSYFANRGTSGIDGCTSTALGASLASKQPVTFISGDLAFMYDSNALWNDLPRNNLKIIVINNGGGGIFRIIEGPLTSGVSDAYFEASHSRSVEHLVAHHGISYWRANDVPELVAGLEDLYASDECGVLEIFTPREENDKILKSYFQFLKKNI